MKNTKKRLASFVAVLPLVMSCTKEPDPKTPTDPIIYRNPPPPEPDSQPATQPEPIIHHNPPPPDEQPLVKEIPLPEPEMPKASYSERFKGKDGRCYVDVGVNPPYTQQVSCKAPIEKPTDGSEWCTVETTKKGERVNVACGKPK